MTGPYRSAASATVTFESSVEGATCLVTVTSDEIVWATPIRGPLVPVPEDDGEPEPEDELREVARVKLADVRRINPQRIAFQRVCLVVTDAGTSYPIEDDRSFSVARTLYDRLHTRDDVTFRVGSWSGALIWLVGALVAMFLLVFFRGALSEALHDRAPGHEAGGRWMLLAYGMCGLAALGAPLMAWRARPRRFVPGARDRW